ncbi:ATP synthase subunit I [Psychromonas sp. CD1]|uniref:ATP synthase subunit I n=1 Tax=Psychromonas sp. CD1 TaxID=1979839 RepID=UPI000B9C4F8D|nr:ATP synthase subunit I [Psychromonas sp. CD1]
MIDNLINKSQKNGLTLVFYQLLIVLLIALILTVFFSIKLGYSYLAGGITFLLPNCIFVLRAFALADTQSALVVLRGVYAGEVFKISFTVLLLVFFLKYVSLSMGAFYISFILLIISQCIAPFFFYNNVGIKHG